MDASQRDLIGPDTRTKHILLTRSSNQQEQQTTTQKQTTDRYPINCSANPCNPHSHSHSNAQRPTPKTNCPLLNSTFLFTTPHCRSPSTLQTETTRGDFCGKHSTQLYAIGACCILFLLMTSGLVHLFGDTRLVQKEIILRDMTER